MILSDSEFINKIENLKLDPSEFTHVGHLRLGWLYLRSYDLEVAIVKTCETIKTYAESLGASTKYNRTITEALVIILASRMNSESTWNLFVESNKDLRDNCLSVLECYYTSGLLMSDEARLNFVSPDIKSF